jgi:hypothetical protein
MGARCYKGGIDSFVADNIFFLSNDVNDEMLLLTCGPLPFDAERLNSKVKSQSQKLSAVSPKHTQM